MDGAKVAASKKKARRVSNAALAKLADDALTQHPKATGVLLVIVRPDDFDAVLLARPGAAVRVAVLRAALDAVSTGIAAHAVEVSPIATGHA